MKTTSFFIALLLLCSSQLFAFESDEHAFISSNGLAIAQQHYVNKSNAICKESSKVCDQVRGTFDVFLKTHKAKQVGLNSTFYGLLSVFGDYQADPYDYFKIWGNFSGLPDSKESERFNAEYIALLENFDGGYRLFHASHNNTDHFQEQMMFSYWWWHKLAIEKAAEGNLFAAMLFNSFADHFLEDFFAPGHIQTPRENMNDAYATAVHDFYNKKGSRFKVNQGQRLLALLGSAQEGGVGTLKKVIFNDNEYQQLEKILNEDGTLYLYGDHAMSHSETNLQQLFMSLIIARSVSDVIDTYVNSQKEHSYVLTNSFGQFFWTSRTTEVSGLKLSVKPAMAKITFGEYKPPGHIIPLYSTVFDIGINHVSTLTLENEEERSATEVDLLFSIFGTYFHPLGNNSRSTNGKVNKRFRYNIFPFGGSIPVGFSYLADDYTEALKLKIEPMWHFSKYSAFIGVPVTYGKYDHKQLSLSSERLAGGVEVGMGFGMVHFVGGVTLDSLYAKQGALDQMILFKAGIRVIFPGSRLPWSSKINN